MPEGQVLEFTRVTKRFGDVTAVSDLSARVEPGVVTGFLGPNGAGKTTSLRMLLGQIRPTMGTATIGGKAYSELRHPLRTVGSLLEDTVYRPRRTATRQLTILAKANGIPLSRVDEVLRLVGLQNDAETRIGGFSLGMRQRLSVATALLGDPGALVLDEPANGLDPEGIRWMRMLMRRLADEGRTVLVSSHVLSEIEQVADNVVVLSRGHAEYTGSIEDLVDPTTGSVVVDAEDRSALAAALTASGLGYDVLRSGLTVRGADAARVGAIAAGAGIALTTLLQRGPSLEEVFLDLVYGRRSASPRLNEVANPVAHAAGALAADASLPTEVAALVDGADAETAASEGSDADADADAAALPLGDAALLASGAAVVGAAGVVGAGVAAAADSADADADAAGGEATDAASKDADADADAADDEVADAASEGAAVASSDEADADSAEQTSEPEAADQTDEHASTDDAEVTEQDAAATTSDETPSSDDMMSSDEAAQSDETQSDEAQPEDADGDDATRVLTLPEVAGDDDEGSNEDGAEVLPLATMAVSLAPEAERLTFTELITGVRATDSESTAEAASDEAATEAVESAESDEDEASTAEAAADAAGVEIFSPLLDSDEDADGSVDDQEQDDPRLAAMRTSLSAAAHAYFEAPAPAYPYGEVDREEQEARTWTVATTGVIDTVPTAADAGSDSSDQADAAERADDDQQDQAGEENAEDNGGEHEHGDDEPGQHESADHESSEHDHADREHTDHEHSGHERRERREHEQREHDHGGAEHHGDEHGDHQHHDGEATHDGEAAHDDNADDHSDNHAPDDGSGEHHSEHNEQHSEHEHEHDDGEHDHQGGEHTGEHGHHEHHDGDHHEHHNHEHHN